MRLYRRISKGVFQWYDCEFIVLKIISAAGTGGDNLNSILYLLEFSTHVAEYRAWVLRWI
jgi:hypothetical protein